MTAKNPDRRCQGRSKSGKPCGAAATAGGLCFLHANPNKASELGRIGGRSKRGSAGEVPEPLPKLDSAEAVRDATARLIADLMAGKVSPKIAAGVASLLTLQLRAIDAVERSNLQERIAKLQEFRLATELSGGTQPGFRPASRQRTVGSDGRGSRQTGNDGAEPN